MRRIREAASLFGCGEKGCVAVSGFTGKGQIHVLLAGYRSFATRLYAEVIQRWEIASSKITDVESEFQ